MLQNVVIVGAGITGALCAASLQKQLPNASIQIWDKARGVAGRMTTSRSPTGTSNADLGAQYVSTSKQLKTKHSDVYNLLIEEHLLEPLNARVVGMKSFPPDTTHWVAPSGMGSLVKRFLSDLPSESVKLNHQVSSISKGNQLKVSTTDGRETAVDVLISTIPVPQFLALKGVSELLDSKLASNLREVRYTSRFVLVYFYDDIVPLPNADWGSKYLQHDIFRYVSVENVKRSSTNATAVVFHTSIVFGANNATRAKEDVAVELEASARQMFPDWPLPTSTKCHKWLYSQVDKGYPDSPGCLVIKSKPLLILAGDAFTESNFNGCIESAQAAVKAVLQN